MSEAEDKKVDMKEPKAEHINIKVVGQVRSQPSILQSFNPAILQSILPSFPPPSLPSSHPLLVNERMDEWMMK